MGITDLTYHAFQAVMWSKSISMGDQLDLDNPFSWEKVVLNIPGTKEYDYQQPWVFKKRVDGLLAVDLLISVENRQTIGPTKTL